MTDTVSVWLFGSAWLGNIGAVSAYVHCLHFGLFLSSHQNGPLISVCTILAKHDERNSSLFSFPAFSFKDTVNFSMEETAARIMKQLVSESPSKKQRELNLCSQRLFLLTQSTTAPPGMLLPKPCIGLHTHLTQIQSLPHSYAQRFINILIPDLSKRERYPPHM